MKKLGKSSKKGFTLVELIVVLVILAVLAAMLVPALVGYIDKAKAEKEFQTASTVYSAAQAAITEAYGKNDLKASSGVFTQGGFKAQATDTNTTLPAYGSEVATLAGVAVDDPSTANAKEGPLESFSFNYTDYIITGGTVVISGHTYTLTITDGTPSWSAV